ncbi:MAG: S-methyl thiohydantoin desulfurase domain-containing protein, partial [Candidatus Heimdallarchaeaceae archaeon]
MEFRVLSASDLESLIIGATILGTGGGGSKDIARELAKRIISSGKTPKLLSVDSIPDDETCAIIGMVGGGVSNKELKYIENLQASISEPMLEAVKVLEKHLLPNKSKGFFGLYATEMGPENIILPIFVASMIDKYVIDGDACGRSKPEISISTTHVYGLAITPLSIVSKYGDYLILDDVQNDHRAEAIVRHFAIMSGGEVACCRCPAKGKDLKNGAIIPGTISSAIELGNKVQESRKEGVDLVATISTAINGKVLF